MATNPNSITMLLVRLACVPLLLTLYPTSLALQAKYTAPVVTTSCGKITGVKTNSTTAFLGIPYAQPPLGRHGRWMPAQPGTCDYGDDGLMAVHQPPACMQMVFPMGPINQSEDCLYLNVFQPSSTRDTANQSTPVFVWLYGGDNTMGSTTFYGPMSHLAELTESIVVAFNYRLAGLGFLALKELSELDPRSTSGNYGITDCQAALRWVQNHIANFGGDKNRVTVIGQSSGATNILAMLASPASKGLFSAAISLSGSVNISMDLNTAEKQGAEYVSQAKCDSAANTLDCLYNLSAIEAMKATPNSWNPSFAGFHKSLNFPRPGGLTIVDGVTVTMPVLHAVKIGLVDVSLIVSNLQAEMDLEADPIVTSWTTAKQFDDFCDVEFKDYDNNAAAAIPILYSAEVETTPSLAYYALNADVGITCASDILVRNAAMSFKHPVYRVYVTSSPAKTFKFFGLPVKLPFHMWDYIAATANYEYFSLHTYTPEPSDIKFGSLLIDMWTQLANTGKLSPSTGCVAVNKGDWPNVMQTCVVDANITTVGNFKTDTCASLTSFGFAQTSWWVN